MTRCDLLLDSNWVDNNRSISTVTGVCRVAPLFLPRVGRCGVYWWRCCRCCTLSVVHVQARMITQQLVMPGGCRDRLIKVLDRCTWWLKLSSTLFTRHLVLMHSLTRDLLPVIIALLCTISDALQWVRCWNYHFRDLQTIANDVRKAQKT